MARGSGEVLELPDQIGFVRVAKEGGAHDEDICSCVDDGMSVCPIDSSINLNERGKMQTIDQVAQGANLLDDGFDAALAAESRVHGHEQHHVADRKEILEAADGSLRIEHNAGSSAQFANTAEIAMRVRAGFEVKGDAVCSCRSVLFEPPLGLLDHQMYIEREG